MKLKMIQWLEEEILHRVVDNTKLGRASLTPHYPGPEESEMLKMQAKRVVDYRIRIGARAKVDPSNLQGGREDVFRLLCREIYKDLIEELHQLEEWGYLEGYDDAMLKKIRRLIRLCHGEEVQDG